MATSRRALFDVNVLIALLDRDHIGHEQASAWYGSNLDDGWASCPLTENGTARIMANPGYPNSLPVAAIIERLAEATQDRHEFWPDDASLLDSAQFDRSAILGPRQITDHYLLALAVRRGGRLVTFDGGIRPTAVRGANAAHIVCLR